MRHTSGSAVDKRSWAARRLPVPPWAKGGNASAPIAASEHRRGGVRDAIGSLIVNRFRSYDGTTIAFRVLGEGPPLVCVPGGPGRAVDYLGDLGGLAASRQLVLMDLRGVGRSADPTDPTTFRVDRLVDDVEALRAHLGLDQMDLLAHSAGAVLASLYAARYPMRLSALLLVTPGLAAVGVYGTDDSDAALERSATEPWFADAAAALARIRRGDLSVETFRASRPLFYGRWDAAAQAHACIGISERYMAARVGYFADLTLDVASTTAALKQLSAAVLLYVGELDPLVTPAMATAAAPVFSNATVVVQPTAAHFPWVEDGAAFATALSSFDS
jgi:pimeloyl-ACP methyl ester carboxylesterase